MFSFLELLLYLAVVIFIAFVIVWLIWSFLGWPIDPMVYKWGQVIVGLICLIAIFVWLGGVLGVGGFGLPHFLVR